MEKRELLYSGKAKSVYTTDDPDYMVLEFRNDTSAFDGKKVEQLDRKGMVNNKFNAYIMTKLAEAGIPTHFERLLSDTDVWHFGVGMIKAPFFALIIGIIGCYEGLRVGGDAESLGRRTSTSVVLSIFMVIVMDALFSIFFAVVGV